jgi:hypothetical protein
MCLLAAGPYLKGVTPGPARRRSLALGWQGVRIASRRAPPSSGRRAARRRLDGVEHHRPATATKKALSTPTPAQAHAPRRAVAVGQALAGGLPGQEPDPLLREVVRGGLDLHRAAFAGKSCPGSRTADQATPSRDQLVLTGIWRGLVSAFFGSFTVSTPFL